MGRSFTKKTVEERLKKNNYEPSAKLYSLPGELDRVLHIVIPGIPIADDRIRSNKILDTMYNPHKAALMKVFDKVYESCPILQNICIMGTMKIKMNVYVPMIKKYLKILDDKNLEKLNKEKLNAVTRPDNDNYEKVHFDVLQDDKYMILLRDEAIFENHTTKYYVADDRNCRVEIFIYFSSQIDPWYLTTVTSSTQYFKYTISPKYMRINKIPEEKWSKTMVENAKVFRSFNRKIGLLRPLKQLLYRLSTPEIHILGENGKNREESESNIYKMIERIDQ